MLNSSFRGNRAHKHVQGEDRYVRWLIWQGSGLRAALEQKSQALDLYAASHWRLSEWRRISSSDRALIQRHRSVMPSIG